MIGALFGQLGTRIFGGLTIALAIACALLWIRGNHYERDRDAWKSAFKAQEAAYGAAQNAAKAKAIAARVQAETRYQELKVNADERTQAAMLDARVAADRYWSTHRLRAESVAGSSGGPGTGTEGGNPQGPNGNGASAELVAINRDDFDVCTENSVRLKAAYDWALTLNQELPVPAF